VPRFHVSLKTRLLLIQTGIWLIGMAVAGALILKQARAAVRAESTSNLQLVQQLLGPVLADHGATLSQEALEDVAKVVSRVRHVQVVTDPSRAGRQTERAIPVSGVPGWFVQLVAPPPEALPRIVLFGHAQTQNLVIEADPADEIREAWEEVRTFLWIAGGIFLLVCSLVYVALWRGLQPLTQLLTAFERLEHDDFTTRVNEQAVPELAQIHRQFNRMAEVLGATVHSNRVLAGHLVNLQEEERRGLARELHDDMAPYLFDIKIRTSAICNLLERHAYLGIPAQLEAIDATIGQLQGQVRELLRRLRPLTLDELGLEQALRDLVAAWSSRYHQVDWKLEVHGPLDRLSDTLCVTVYRIVQECLTNIARHAEAQCASVRITVAPPCKAAQGRLIRDGEMAGRIDIRVQDDGKGMPPGTRFGLGLTGVQERVQALGGALTVERRDDDGVRVHAWIPVTRAEGSGEDLSGGVVIDD
jgi:two-component system, NarL family, sensor histidine kinase UhpB